MSSPAPHVVPIFATPFGVVTVPEAEALNPALRALFLERASRESGAPGASSGALAFRSRDDLVDRPEEPLRTAIGGIVSGVSAVAASISDFSAEQFGASVRFALRQQHASTARVHPFLPLSRCCALLRRKHAHHRRDQLLVRVRNWPYP